MMGMPPGVPAGGADQEVGDQIKSEITVGGKKNKTHYGKKFGKKHKSAMLDFTKSLWMQDAAASLRNVLKSEVGWFRVSLEIIVRRLAHFTTILHVICPSSACPGRQCSRYIYPIQCISYSHLRESSHIRSNDIVGAGASAWDNRLLKSRCWHF